MATTLHSTLIGTELHYSKVQTTPSSIILNAPSYIGQTFFDTSNNIMYIATSTASAAGWIAITGSGGPLSVIDSASTSYTVTSLNNNSVIRMTNTAARAVAMPAGPINGFTVIIQDAAETAYTANITLTRGGGTDTFQGGGTTYTINSNTTCIVFVYDSGTSTWIVRSSFIGFQPTVSSIQTKTGADLNIFTSDTFGINLKVNSVNALTLSTSAITMAIGSSSVASFSTTQLAFLISNANAMILGATNLEVKKTLLLDDASDATKQLQFQVSGATTGTKTILAAAQTANRTLTLPDATDTLVGKATTDILTNKSFNSATTMLAANQLRFNNAGNTFYTSIIGGNNTSNLSLTLPTTAPVGGQALVSNDTIGTLRWATIPEIGQQTYPSATNINTLPSNTPSIVIIGSTATNLNGIVAGTAGQEITVNNSSSALVTVVNQSGSASAANTIYTPNAKNEYIPSGFTMKFTYYSTTGWLITSMINSMAIQGNITGIAQAQGFIGEYQAASTSSSPIAGTTWTAITSINLTPGIWSISGMVGIVPGSAFTQFIFMTVGRNVGSGTTAPADSTIGINYAQVQTYTDTIAAYCVGTPCVPSWNTLVTTNTTFYLNAYAGTAINVSGIISAIRVG